MTEHPQTNIPRKWFAFLDTERIVYLGEYASFHEADDAAYLERCRRDRSGGSVVWIFPEENLLPMLDSARAALAQAHPENPSQITGHLVKGEQSQIWVDGPQACSFTTINGHDPVISITAMTRAGLASQ